MILRFNKYVSFFAAILLACFGLSFFCLGPKLTKDLVNKSDIIFEGQFIKADTLEENEVLLSFKVLKIHKGVKEDLIKVKSHYGSSGFGISYKNLNKDIGLEFLIYSNKRDSCYTYEACTNRKVPKTPRKYEYYEAFENRDVYNKKLIRYDSIYKAEIKKLVSLLKKSK